MLPFFIYPALFYFIWVRLFSRTLPGLAVACFITPLFGFFHGSRIDGMYTRWKKIVAVLKVSGSLILAYMLRHRRDNETLAMLELRATAIRELTDLLIWAESSRITGNITVEEEEAVGPCRFSPDTVDWYRQLGARITPIDRKGFRSPS